MTEIIIETRTRMVEPVCIPDYSDYERRLQIIELRGRLLELRYNHNHDDRGRFCSGGGGGSFSSSKKLYSNGGANTEKSVDNSSEVTEQSSANTNKSEKSADSDKSIEKTSEECKFSLTDFLKNDTITDKETAFREYLANGDINTTIEKSQQQKHQVTKAWKNQVKQAVASNYRQNPKSLLDKSIDPQEFVDKYAGTGIIDFPKNGTVVHEYITTSEPIGKTFDKKIGKYKVTKKMQIKYTQNGVHIFPTIEGGD